MSSIQKRIEKFYKKPIPSDITYEDVKAIAKHFGCIVTGGGKHPLHILHLPTGMMVPIPCHGKTVKEAYIKELKELFDRIEATKR